MDTKICSRCNQDKPVTEFFKTKNMKDGLQSACKKCMNISYKNSRDKKQKHYTSVAVARYERNREQLREWKATQKCSCCIESDPDCLDLHHLDPSKKDVNISDVVAYWSWKRLQREIEKCIVVCANCHRKIHKGKIIISDIGSVW